MPSLTFVMPHWLYWAGLIIFPAVASYLVRRQMRHPLPPGPSLFIAYLFWLCSGFMGIHRFYLRSAYGFVFIPVFLAIIYCTSQVREVRDDTSRTFAALEQAQTAAEQAKPRSETPTPEAAAQYARAQADIKPREADYAVAKAVTDHWVSLARWSAIAAGGLAADRCAAVAEPRAQAPCAGSRERSRRRRSWKWIPRSCTKLASARTRRCICTRASPMPSSGSASRRVCMSRGGR